MKLPETLIEAIGLLRRELNDEQKEYANQCSEEEFLEAHRQTAEAVRTGWKLWDFNESPLFVWFESRGVKYVGQMSTIILRSLHRRLNGKKIRLKSQISRLQGDPRA